MLINTSAQLIAALKAGATSIVIANSSLSDVHIENMVATSPVVISSPAGSARATFGGCFGIVKSAKLIIRNIKLDLSKCSDPYWPGRIQSSSNIVFDSVEVLGNGPSSSAGGILIQDSEDITFKNSWFHDLGSVALNVGRVKRLAVEDTEFSNWGKSAVGIGQIQGLVFRGNNIHDAHPTPGTHPDALQLFTTGTKEQSSDLTIEDNKLSVGEGGAFQGIFIQDEIGDKPYRNVKIINNVILGSMWNAIYLKRASGTVEILHNKAFSWRLPNPTATRPGAETVKTDFTAGILVWTTDGANLIERGNQAQRFTDARGNPSGPPTGNFMAYDAK